MIRQPQMRNSLPLILLVATSCQIKAPLEEGAWAHLRPGEVGWTGRFGVHNDHLAETTISLDTNFGFTEVDMETELEGELGLALGVEAFIDECWSLVVGYEHRSLAPGETPGFIFKTVTSQEWFIGARWHTPWTFGEDDRWRPVIEAKFAFLPETRFDAEVDLSSINQPNPEYRFAGSSYWNFALAAGLEYQATPSLVWHGAIYHEVPLSNPTDLVHLEFIPGFDVDLLTEIEPAGTMVMFGFTWIP